MTILAQANTGNLTGVSLPSVPVDVAARIIAAGIVPQLDARGRPLLGPDGKPIQLARETRAVTPMKADASDKETIELVNWQAAIGALLAPGSTIQVQVVPIDKDGGR